MMINLSLIRLYVIVLRLNDSNNFNKFGHRDRLSLGEGYRVLFVSRIIVEIGRLNNKNFNEILLITINIYI